MHRNRSASRAHVRAYKQVINRVPRGHKQMLGNGIDIGKIRRLYSDADVDGDGSISKDELVALLQDGGLDHALATQHATGFFQMVDKDGSGTVSFDEFLQNYIRMEIFRIVKAMQIGEISLEEIDSNHDGRISKSEILAVFRKQLGEEYSIHVGNELFEEMDRDHSGYVTFDEIARWYAEMAAKVKLARSVHETHLQARKNPAHVVERNNLSPNARRSGGDVRRRQKRTGEHSREGKSATEVSEAPALTQWGFNKNFTTLTANDSNETASSEERFRRMQKAQKMRAVSRSAAEELYGDSNLEGPQTYRETKARVRPSDVRVAPVSEADRPESNHCDSHVHFIRACPDCRRLKNEFMRFQKLDYDSLKPVADGRQFCYRHYLQHGADFDCFDCKLAERAYATALWSTLQDFDERRQYCPVHFSDPQTDVTSACIDCKHAAASWGAANQEHEHQKLVASEDAFVAQSLQRIMCQYKVNLYEVFRTFDYVRTGALDKKEFTEAFLKVANFAWEEKEEQVQKEKKTNPNAANTQIRFTESMVSEMFDRYAGKDRELDYTEWLQQFQLELPAGDKREKQRGTLQDVQRLQGLLVQIHNGYHGQGALKALFKKIDRDGSGFITKAELKAALSEALVKEVQRARDERRPVAHWAKRAGPLPELGVRPDDVDKLFSFVDYSNSGKISLHKFVAALQLSTKIEAYTATDSDIGLE